MIAYRNIFFVMNYTGFSLSLPTVFLWYIGESASHDLSLFGTQETTISHSENCHANVSLCLFMNLTDLVSLDCTITYPTDLEGSNHHKQADFLPAA